MKLSVCIPVYNVECYVEKCVRSLFEQTYRDLEFVFVDDCTPDGSIGVVKRVLADYPHRCGQVRFVRHDRNRGVAVARLTALRAATGDLVTYCDPDDWVDTELYAQMVARLEASGGDAVMCQACFESEAGSVVRACSEEFCMSGAEALRKMDRIPGLSAVFLRIVRRELMNLAEIECPPGISVAEDLCLSAQVLSRCHRLVNLVNGVYYHYRVRSQSLSHGRKAGCIVVDHMKVFDVLTRRIPNDCSRIVRRHLARTILYWGVVAGMLSRSEYSRWRDIYRTLGGRWDWSDKSLWGQRLMKLADRSVWMSRLVVPFVKGKVNDDL